MWQRTLPLVLFSSAVGLYVAHSNGNDSPAILVTALAVIGTTLAITLRILVRRQCDSFRTFRLTLTDDRIVREQEGFPILEIAFSNISQLTEDPHSGLRVRGADRYQDLFVPVSLENYADVKGALAQYQTVEVTNRLRWSYPRTLAVGAGTAALYAICFLSRNSVYVISSGILLVAVLVGSFYFTLRSPHISKRTKRVVWLTPLVLLSILARLFSHDPTGRLATKLDQLSDAGKYREVIAVGTSALTSTPPNGAILSTMANAYYETNALPDAMAFALKASALDPTAEHPARIFVLACRDREMYDEGLQFGQNWIKRNPHGASIYRDLALLADDAGKRPLAYEFATEGFKRRPADAHIAGVYFFYAAQFRAPAEVNAEAEKWAAQYTPSVYFWAQVGKGLSDAGAATLALPILQNALRLGSKDSSVVTEIMDSYRTLGDYQMAEAFVESYRDTHEPTAALWRMLGAIYYDNEMYEEALEKTEKARELDPDDPIAASNLIFTLYELKRSAEGIEFGKQWLASGKASPTSAFHRALGHAYFARDEFEEAERHYREALKLNPAHVFSARDLLSTLVHEDRASDAVAFGEQWLREHPEIHEASFDEVLEHARAAVPSPDEIDAKGTKTGSRSAAASGQSPNEQ